MFVNYNVQARLIYAHFQRLNTDMEIEAIFSYR